MKLEKPILLRTRKMCRFSLFVVWMSAAITTFATAGLLLHKSYLWMKAQNGIALRVPDNLLSNPVETITAVFSPMLPVLLVLALIALLAAVLTIAISAIDLRNMEAQSLLLDDRTLRKSPLRNSQHRAQIH